MFALSSLFVGLWDYIINLPAMSLTVWRPDGNPESIESQLAGWQGGWTIFYWAWWIAFAPFVGLFLARISRGRSFREYVLGAMIVPSIMCFVWFTVVGGTAIDLTLNGDAGDAITSVGISSQLFAMINHMLSPAFATIMSLIIVILLLTYLVTSADSAVLIINTIAAGGDASQKPKVHIIVWGLALTLMIGTLLVAGGLGAINTAMIIGALPFSIVMALMGISLFKAVIRDGMRKRGIAEIGVNPRAPDFLKLAEAFGCPGVQVEDEGAFRAAMAAAFEHAGPTLIIVREDDAWLT